MSGKRNQDLVHQKFSRLTVVQNAGMINGQTHWLCQCECGNTKIVSQDHLKRQQVKSCGCLFGLKKQESPYWTGYGDISGQKWSALNGRARLKGLKVEISIKEAWELLLTQDNKCALTGLPISIKEKTASLDRIDSSQGYLLNNIQWVHKKINKMKMDLSKEEFIELCKLVSRHIVRDYE